MKKRNDSNPALNLNIFLISEHFNRFTRIKYFDLTSILRPSCWEYENKFFSAMSWPNYPSQKLSIFCTISGLNDIEVFFISIDRFFTIKTSLWFIIKNRTQWTRTSMDIKVIFHQYEPPDWMFVIMMVRVKFLISLKLHEEFFFTWTREKVNGTRWILDEFTVVHDYKTLVTQRLINHKTFHRYFTIEKTRLIVLLEVKI